MPDNSCSSVTVQNQNSLINLNQIKNILNQKKKKIDINILPNICQIIFCYSNKLKCAIKKNILRFSCTNNLYFCLFFTQIILKIQCTTLISSTVMVLFCLEHPAKHLLLSFVETRALEGVGMTCEWVNIIVSGCTSLLKMCGRGLSSMCVLCLSGLAVGGGQNKRALQFLSSTHACGGH